MIFSASLTSTVVFADPTHGVITIAFDDGMQDEYDYAFPLMQERGIAGTFYIVTDHISDFNGDNSYMSIAELQTLQNYGNEIGSHSKTHDFFTTLSDSQIREECSVSQQVLQSYGFPANNFAYPYGDRNDHTDTIVDDYYRSGRTSYGPYSMPLPVTQFLIYGNDGETGDSTVLSWLESIVDQIYSSNQWGIVYFHHVIPNLNTDPYTISSQNFEIFLDYVVSRGVPTVTVQQGLDLYSPPNPPTVTISPTSLRLDLGQSRIFTSTVTGGNPPYTYQWYRNGTAVSGATSSTWTFTPSAAGHYGVQLIVTDAADYEGQSNIVTDIIVYAQPTVTISPAQVNMTINATQQFTSAVAGGLAPYTYQWYYSNNTAITGATASTLTYKANQTGTYIIYLNATDSTNYKAKSNNATINVYSQPTVTISPAQVNMTINATQQFTSAVAGGLAPYTYQWYYSNNTAITGATASTLTYKANQTGTYIIYLNATDSTNYKAKSNNATINVYSQPTVTISPTTTKMYFGQTQTFNSSVSGGYAPYTYQWFLNDTAVSGATGSTWTFAPKSDGHYKVYLNVTDGLNFRAQSNVVSDFIVCSIYLHLTSDQGSYVKGESVTFTVNVFNQLDPALKSSLTLTVNGPGNYGYFDVQPIIVPAGTVGEYTFNWTVPNVSGRYTAEVELAPSLLTAYDTTWLEGA